MSLLTIPHSSLQLFRSGRKQPEAYIRRLEPAGIRKRDVTYQAAACGDGGGHHRIASFGQSADIDCSQQPRSDGFDVSLYSTDLTGKKQIGPRLRLQRRLEKPR